MIAKRQNIEEKIQMEVAAYIRKNYPKVLFLSDASGIRLPMVLAKKAKSQRSYQFKIPDMFIARPVGGYAGMFLELKKDASSVLNKQGQIRKQQHLNDQLYALTHLRKEGYYAVFGLGYEDAIREIEFYLNLNQ